MGRPLPAPRGGAARGGAVGRGARLLGVGGRRAGAGRVPQLHGAHALGDAARLVTVEVLGLAGVDLAEVAATGALVTADEERRLAVLPALEDVGAAGRLADRVQPLVLHQLLQGGVLGAGAQRRLDPRRLALDGGLRIADL